ncbi:MAG: hypothetical protein HY822_21340 [Acidobacteria bacterium]|nr:hypothetical protein [Acidobacteriota bacterium]
MTDLAPLHDFLRRARRRARVSVALEQTALGAGAALAGAVLLLLLGTQILEWYWLLLLFLGGFAWGLARALRRVPSVYRLAQQVDRRLELHDCLSTAYYFSAGEFAGRGNLEMRELAGRRADELCAALAPEAAVPLRAPRAGYATLALAVLVLGMFGLRYGVRGSLDLRPPLMQSLIDFFRPSRQIAETRKPATRAPKLPPEAGLATGPEGPRPADPNPLQDEFLTSDETIRADQNSLTAQPDDNMAGDTGEEADGERTSAGDGQQGKDSDEAGKQNGDDGKSGPKDSPNENSDLLDKMRDAFQNMLAKLKIQTKTGEQAQKASKQGKPGGTQKQEGKQGEMSQDRAPGQGQPRPDQQGDQMAAGGENSQVAQGQQNQRNREPNGADGEKSGIGKSDGIKDIRAAEQLAAMGKISELFGKRQANLTGEVLVEVQSSRQQGLKTPYLERGAAHGEGGGEIHRDEVPLMYQQYVQQYFEQVRKAAPAAEKP